MRTTTSKAPRSKQPSDPRVAAHYHVALDHIQSAQNQLGRAAALLCSINLGGAVDWRRLNREYQRVRTLWYQLDDRLPKLRREQLDGGHGEYPCSACDAVKSS